MYIVYLPAGIPETQTGSVEHPKAAKATIVNGQTCADNEGGYVSISRTTSSAIAA
jgi:hypothetical protein